MAQTAPSSLREHLAAPATIFATLLLLCGPSPTAGAQIAADPATAPPQGFSPLQLAAVAPIDPSLPFSTSASAAPEDSLPTAPTPQTAPPQTGGLSASTPPATPGQHPIAPLHAKYIPAGYRAQPLGVHDKVITGIGDLYSVENFAAIILSAGYEHVLNSEPNYGTDKGAFGERIGAAAIRETTQGIFTDMVFAPLLHEDSRYYQKGPQYNFVKRTLYSISRPLITRTDAGNTTVNGALLLGYASAAALSPAYYPQSNRNFHDTAATFGSSIGGAALGFFVNEFSSDVLTALHLKHNP